MGSTWFSSSFLSFLKYPQIKEEGPNSWEKPILQSDWTIWCSLLYFNFRNLKDRSSSLFVRFQRILHDLAVLFSVFWNFVKLRKGDLISWGEPILQNGWIIWSHLLYFNIRNFRDPNCSSFTRFQCILHNSAVIFSLFWNFLKLKKGNVISWGEPILQSRWIIVPSFCISILEIWRTRILRQSLDFNAF